MCDLLDQALAVVRALPSGEQDEIARAMLALAGPQPVSEEVDPDHLADVLEGLAQARRGELATPAQMEAALRRFGP